MKILIHAINGIGLGHVIRTLRVAVALAECRPDVGIVFVTNTKYSEILKRKYKTYTLKRDTRAVIEKQYSYEEYLRYNTMAISKIIVHEKPDAVLFDCELNKELVLFCRAHLIKIVYVLRIPTAERFSAIKEDLTLFDLIIVPHDENDFPAEQKEALLKRRAVFTGPIVDRCDYSADSIRENVLMTFGSGAGIMENFPFFSAADSFLKFLRENNSVIDGYPIHMDIVTGPFYEGGCDLSGFQVRSTSDSLVRDMYKAKAVISAAGYNTINEIVHTKTPAVVVPLSRRWDDQFQRADRLERLGCIRVARNSILDPLRDVLKNWQIYHDKFPCMRSGNQQAARVLSEVLGEKEK